MSALCVLLLVQAQHQNGYRYYYLYFTILYNLPHCNFCNNDFRQSTQTICFFFKSWNCAFFESCSLKICYFRRKTPVFDPLFNKAAIRPAALLEKDSTTGFFCQYYKTFKNIYFVEHLKTTATVVFQNYFPEYLKEAALHFNIFQFCLF